MAGRVKVSQRIANIFSDNKWTWKSWQGVPCDPFTPDDIHVNDFLDRMVRHLVDEQEPEVGEEYTRWSRLVIKRNGYKGDVYVRVGTVRLGGDD